MKRSPNTPKAARRPLTSRQSPNARRAASAREAAYDRTLVERVRNGDEGAFAEIVGRYRERMFGVAPGLLRDRHDAEEIVQDTFVRAHRGIHRFRGDCSLVAWLHRITVILARNRYWYFHRRSRHSTLSLDCSLAEEANCGCLHDQAAFRQWPLHSRTRSLVITSLHRRCQPAR